MAIMTRTSRIVGLATVALMLGACGPPGSDQQVETEPRVEALGADQLSARRAEERWQALIAWDQEKAYSYLSPGTRQVISLAAYAKKNAMAPVHYEDVVVKSTQCENQVCTVTLELHYIYRGSVAAMRGQAMSSTITEKWVEADGSWFYVPD